MRVVFMGASELGWECCRALFEAGQQVVGVFSIPREFRISWSPGAAVTNVRFKSFEGLAAAHSVPLVYVTKKMSDPEYAEEMRRLRPDLLIVVGWYYMLPRSLREAATLGAVGLHASLLPKYRGGAPLVWAVINGETSTGVSLFHFADGVDDGDLVGQARFDIGEGDDIAALVGKATEASVGLMRECVPLLASGDAPRVPQDHSLATVVPQRRPEDGLIDWGAKSARQAYDWVRAQTRPYPGAFTYLNGEKLIVWRAAPPDARDEDGGAGAPGSIVRKPAGAADGFGVRCADGRLLRVLEVGDAGGACFGGAEFARARALDGGAFDTGDMGNAGVTGR